jgi:hypothetical protein
MLDEKFWAADVEGSALIYVVLSSMRSVRLPYLQCLFVCMYLGSRLGFVCEALSE